jgi:Ni/Fe-hydrogenase 1 B-type cytochrome subunit
MKNNNLAARSMSGNPSQPLAPGRVRVYVWEWPIRCSHWVIAITILSLSITGYYMHSPYIIAQGRGAYVMGTMRFIHLLSAFAFIFAVALRMVWFFFGNRWAGWRQYIPASRKRWNELSSVGKYYTFMSWRPDSFIGHNPLAGAAYAIVYGLAIIEILTGLALYTQILHSRFLDFLVGWLPRLLDIQWLREIHFLIMFAFWMFFIHHLYTAILIAIEEKSGLMDSIFSGYKFVPVGQIKKEARDLGFDVTSELEGTQAEEKQNLPTAV